MKDYKLIPMSDIHAKRLNMADAEEKWEEQDLNSSMKLAREAYKQALKEDILNDPELSSVEKEYFIEKMDSVTPKE